MEITFKDGFSLTDLYLVTKSYSDSLISIPIQMMVEVEDLLETNRRFFSDSISVHRITEMTLIDFSQWYSLRWEKDAKYIGHEIFAHKLIFRFSSITHDILYPIYPWKDSILKEVLSSSITERGETIKILLDKIRKLEEELKKK